MSEVNIWGAPARGRTMVTGVEFNENWWSIILMMRMLSQIWRGGDEQWWWAKWIWFSGIRRGAKTPIVSPWTQEPNLSRLILMTSNNDEDQGKYKSGKHWMAIWKRLAPASASARKAGYSNSLEGASGPHIWWWYMGTYHPVLMRGWRSSTDGPTHCNSL